MQELDAGVAHSPGMMRNVIFFFHTACPGETEQLQECVGTCKVNGQRSKSDGVRQRVGMPCKERGRKEG